MASKVTSPLSPLMPSSVMNSLPQYGFGPEVTFEGLVAGNPFLFRVHTPRAQPPEYDSSEPYFIGAKYSDKFSSAAISSSSPRSQTAEPASSACTYADVVRHLDWTTRQSSPYISASFSFAWAIWEAIRRYHANVKHDVEIAVIDARAVSDRSITAVELLMRGNPKERHRDHWKWYRFALESQDVLVWGHIPGSAVLASIPLLQILNKLPSYFLYHDVSEAKDSPLFKLGWDYTRKPSYRQFCQAMTDRFMAMSVERRLRDTTVGSVRLALAFLRPFFHRVVSEDFSKSSTHVSGLAYVIAQWPGQWWTREHPEIQELVRCIVHMIGEEMREARRVQALADATRMQEIVGGLELLQAYEARSRPRRMLDNIHLSPLPSPSPTLPPSPSASEPKHAYRIGSVDIITSDMTDSKEVQTDPVEEEDKSIEITEDITEMVDELNLSAPAPEKRTTSLSKPFMIETVARTASCFLTGLLVGSFVALCVFSPDRRQLARHIT